MARMEEDMTMEALSGRTARWPNFGAALAFFRRAWLDFARRSWRQVPISVARLLVLSALNASLR